jgi:hypothetical protein
MARDRIGSFRYPFVAAIEKVWLGRFSVERAAKEFAG